MSLQLKGASSQLQRLSEVIAQERDSLNALAGKERLMRQHYQNQIRLLEQEYGRVSSASENYSGGPSHSSSSVSGSLGASSISDLSSKVEGFHQYMQAEFYRLPSAKSKHGGRRRRPIFDGKHDSSLNSVSMYSQPPESAQSDSSFYKQLPKQNLLEDLMDRREAFIKQKQLHQRVREQSLNEMRQQVREELLAQNQRLTAQKVADPGQRHPNPPVPYKDEYIISLQRKHPYLRRPVKEASLLIRQSEQIHKLRDDIRMAARRNR